MVTPVSYTHLDVYKRQEERVNNYKKNEHIEFENELTNESQ